MKRIKLCLSVIAAMALFIFMNSNIHAANTTTYEEGYSPLNSDTTYVDEIKFDLGRTTSRNNFINYFIYFTRYGYVFDVVRKRTIIGENNYDVLTTYASFNSTVAYFSVSINDEEYFRMSVSYINQLICNVSYQYSKNINFNDPNDTNYSNSERVRLTEPETTIKNYSNKEINIDEYYDYEDFVLIKTYDVSKVIEITDNPINLPSKEELLNRDIELDNGLKIESNNNQIYGGNYELDNYGFINEGIYYLKIKAIKDNKDYYIVYKINVLQLPTTIPSIYTTPIRQITEAEIKTHLENNNIYDYTYNADTYYKYFNIPGNYYIDINYRANGKNVSAKMLIIVNEINNQRIKIKEKDLLKIGYNDILDKEAFENNIDFAYIDLDSYEIDYSEYDNNYNQIGNYNIYLYAKSKDGIYYIQVINIEVYDNICPVVSLDDDIDLTFLYTDNIDISKIISKLNIEDISEYRIVYDDEEFKNRDVLVGDFVIEVNVIDINENNMPFSINIHVIDKISPKIIANNMYASPDLLLDTNMIKANVYAKDEIDGIIDFDNISINDANGYKDNYNILGTYRIEVIAKDNSGNEAFASFNIIVSEDEEENKNIIYIDKNNNYTKEELLAYLKEKGYIDVNEEYTLTSSYFDSADNDLDSYELIVENSKHEKEYFEIKINDSNILYESLVEENIENDIGINPIVIVAIIAGILIASSGVLIFIIYKKKH